MMSSLQTFYLIGAILFLGMVLLILPTMFYQEKEKFLKKKREEEKKEKNKEKDKNAEV